MEGDPFDPITNPLAAAIQAGGRRIAVEARDLRSGDVCIGSQQTVLGRPWPEKSGKVGLEVRTRYGGFKRRSWGRYTNLQVIRPKGATP